MNHTPEGSGIPPELSPKTTSKKEQRRGARTKIILASALLFYESGFGGISVEQIARAADYTKGAIYWHFPEDDLDPKSRIACEVISAAQKLWEESMYALSNVGQQEKRPYMERINNALRNDGNLFNNQLENSLIKASWALIANNDFRGIWQKEQFLRVREKFYQDFLNRERPEISYLLHNCTSSIFQRAAVMKKSEVADEINHLIFIISKVYFQFKD